MEKIQLRSQSIRWLLNQTSTLDTFAATQCDICHSENVVSIRFYSCAITTICKQCINMMLDETNVKVNDYDEAE